jgi:uncharacterized protein DUF5047
MTSHQITARGEFWYKGVLLTGFSIVSGSVTADRAGSVRRTAQVQIDPHVSEIPAMKDRLTPYGTYVKLFRGVRYPNGMTEEFQVFYGRIDQVEESLQTISIRCSDRAADIIDARFEDTKWAGDFGVIGTLTCADCAKALIVDVIPAAIVTIDISDAAMKAIKVSGDTSWQRERSDALDQMSTACGAEWFASMYGDFFIRQLPAVATDSTPIKWIIDTGDAGVLVNRTNVNDRQSVYNHVVVISEPFDGREPARGNAYDDDDPLSPTFYGGEFGKVTGFFEGQQVDSNINANKLAEQLLQQAISAVKSISVECVANPQLQLADVVRVFDPRNAIDAMFFVQSFELPLDPETPMRMTLYSARQKLARSYGDMRRRIPVGATWQPIP